MLSLICKPHETMYWRNYVLLNTYISHPRKNISPPQKKKHTRMLTHTPSTLWERRGTLKYRHKHTNTHTHTEKQKGMFYSDTWNCSCVDKIFKCKPICSDHFPTFLQVEKWKLDILVRFYSSLGKRCRCSRGLLLLRFPRIWFWPRKMVASCRSQCIHSFLLVFFLPSVVD